MASFSSKVLGVLTVTMFLGSSAACSSKTIINNTSSSSGGGEEGSGQRRESVPCSKGKTTLPIDAYDLNDPAETPGTSCQLANVLDQDESFAALDAPAEGTRMLDGRAVSACIAAEFGDGITLGSLTMKMRPIGQGCGHQCSREGDNGCGTGWQVSVFAGPSVSKLQFVQELPLTTKDFFEYRIALFERFQARFIAVCRTGPITTDDVAIESVYGFCN